MKVRELIEERKDDIFVSTETWHHQVNDLSIKQVCGSDYAVLECSQEQGRGGGVAIFFRSQFGVSPISLSEVTAFKLI